MPPRWRSPAALYDDYGYRHGPYGYGDYAYAGERWRGFEPYRGDLTGPGTDILDPWLIGTEEGRRIVATGFRSAGHGFVDDGTAHRANIWFRRYADSDCDLELTDAEIRVALVQASREHWAARD